MDTSSKKIGIYSGSFDPVHNGHIEFAEAALRQVRLDKVYFLPEGLHRTKRGTTHFAHRLAMLKLATQDHQKLEVLELPDKQFSVAKTLPRLNQKFVDDELFMLIGSDILDHLPDWPLIDRLLARLRLIIAIRQGTSSDHLNDVLKELDVYSSSVLLESPQPALSSRQIRQSLLTGHTPHKLNPNVLNYIKQNWLYASPSNSSSAS